MRFLKRLVLVLFIVALVPAGAIAIFCWRDDAAGIERLPDIKTMAAPAQRYDVDVVGYRRGEERSWLTLPEWYIVYSADEYADYVRDKAPTGFPFFSSVGQFWTAYCRMYHLTNDRYEVATDLHVTNLVIGTSFTIEYVLQGLYENTIGRLTEAVGGTETVEDRHARQVARDYADFLNQTPWYEFPFFSKIGGMWTEIDFTSADVFRRIERRVALTAGYTVRGVYGWLIGVATKLSYAPEEQGTVAVVDTLPAALLAQHPGVRVLTPLDDATQAVVIPRYAAFTDTVLALVRGGAVIREIAGNDEILVSVIAPRGWSSQSLNAVVMFSLPVLTDLSRHRVALWVRVAALHDVVRSLDGSGATIEHVYDY
jgi:hypothetical protein